MPDTDFYFQIGNSGIPGDTEHELGCFSVWNGNENTWYSYEFYTGSYSVQEQQYQNGHTVAIGLFSRDFMGEFY